MRTHLLVATLLLASTGLAGCLGDDADTPGAETNNTANQAPEYTQLDVHDTHDFTQGAATSTFQVPENATANRITIYFDHWSPEGSADGGTCASQEPLTIHVQDPAGNTYEEVTRDSTSFAAGSGSNCGGSGLQYNENGFLVAPGEWTIHYNGTGFAVGHVVFDSP